VLVAFTDQPQRGRFWAASPAALVALKAQAFGRTRHDGKAVDRDFSDAMLLLDRPRPRDRAGDPRTLHDARPSQTGRRTPPQRRRLRRGRTRAPPHPPRDIAAGRRSRRRTRCAADAQTPRIASIQIPPRAALGSRSGSRKNQAKARKQPQSPKSQISQKCPFRREKWSSRKGFERPGRSTEPKVRSSNLSWRVEKAQQNAGFSSSRVDHRANFLPRFPPGFGWGARRGTSHRAAIPPRRWRSRPPPARLLDRERSVRRSGVRLPRA
jgi:hypothetical protein